MNEPGKPDQLFKQEDSAWTHSLDNDKLSDPVPDFSYPELNEMAELIRNSLSSVQQAVDRERRFLRHASHELRTPISTIRSNIELHRKLTQKREKFEDEQNIVDRIDRASLTMKHLTETLLWLNHEPDMPLQSEATDLPELIRARTGTDDKAQSADRMALHNYSPRQSPLRDGRNWNPAPPIRSENLVQPGYSDTSLSNPSIK
ncbi:hypothetical protein MARI_20900 [Marinobacter sp. JH2]|nr:histidine kinase dimerization/phospho-acceptor domain-containing protein [Marinobacter sp. JH2]QBM17966.1 hypothetical protein MARI_20900 [Marinobacter sp. JH2]